MALCPQIYAKPHAFSLWQLPITRWKVLSHPFTSTLTHLSLHKNRLKVLPDLHFKDTVRFKAAILLHNNLLSCYVPWCGNTSVGTSLIAIGNRLRHPEGAFPAWVSQYEHDPLFWVSGVEGIILLLKTSGAVCFFMLATLWSKIGSAKWLRAKGKMANWTAGSLIGGPGIILSSFMLGTRILSGSSLLDASAALGPLCMPSDIGSCKRLLTKQCSRPRTGVPLLVQAFLFSGSGSTSLWKARIRRSSRQRRC